MQGKRLEYYLTTEGLLKLDAMRLAGDDAKRATIKFPLPWAFHAGRCQGTEEEEDGETEDYVTCLVCRKTEEYHEETMVRCACADGAGCNNAMHFACGVARLPSGHRWWCCDRRTCVC